MFTGIIETLGRVEKIEENGSNLHFTISSPISGKLKIDQSLAHNGVCLTVVNQDENTHIVVAIDETLNRSNLRYLAVGDHINLERSMLANARLDGHLVQGHVDATATCESIIPVDGSWYYKFSFPPQNAHLLVDKGSICINGTSLTVVSPSQSEFSVAIIPYTYEHTNFQYLKPGEIVNLEFDIIGKYFARYAEIYLAQK